MIELTSYPYTVLTFVDIAPLRNQPVTLGTPGEPWGNVKRRKLPSREEGAWEAVRRGLPTWLGSPEAETAEEGAVLGV